MVVPPGHQVVLHRASALPGAHRTGGGAWVVSLGTRSDEADEEFDRALGVLEAATPGAPVLLPAAADRLASLMAPHNPPVVAAAGLTVWDLDVDALFAGSRATSRTQRLLQRIHRDAHADVRHCAFVRGGDGARARPFIALLRGLGAEVRALDPKDPALLAEVHRPEGVVLVALLGAPLGAEVAPDPWAREAMAARDGAAGDDDRLARLDDEVRRALAQRLSLEGAGGRVPAVARAPRLRRALAAAASDPAAVGALHDELLARAEPLLFLVDPATRGVRLRAWPGGVTALAAYPDLDTVAATARDLALPPGSFAIGEQRPRDLFAWCAREGWAVALGFYAAPDKPQYVLILAPAVEALARR